MTSQTGQNIVTMHICSISQEVYAIRQWNLFSKPNITFEMFLLKNHTQNVLEKLVWHPSIRKSTLSFSLDRQSQML